MDKNSSKKISDRYSRPAEITRGLQCEMSEIIGDTSDLAINPLDNLQNRKFTETIKLIVNLCKEWFAKVQIVTNVLISDIKTLWIITSGSNLHKAKVIGRFIFYYLIITALSIIEKGFWLNKQIFKVTNDVVLSTVQNKQTTTVLFIFIGIILLGFLLGAAITSSACDD